MNREVMQQEADHEFKNFHRTMCKRFGYTHDERDWKRDQVSLIEWIAKKVEQQPVQQEPVYVQTRYNRGEWGTPLDPKERHSKWADGVEMRLLYTAPQAQPAKPLTDEQIAHAIGRIRGEYVASAGTTRRLVRAIEAAHNIKEKT